MPHGLGKLPFVHDQRDLRYVDLRPKGLSLPPLPAGWGRGMDFASDEPPPKGWGMMGNGPDDDGSVPAHWAAADGAGDCTCADPAHVEMMNAHDAGRPVPKFSAKTVLAQYSQLGAYDPQSGANDNGLEIRQVLQYRQQKGFADDQGNRYKIGTYVSVEVGDWRSLREACWLFSGLAIGITITQAQMDAFHNGQVWSYVPNSQVLGGHDVPIVGHPGPGLWTVITWARRQLVTYQLLQQQCDEVWAYIDPERYSAVTGQTYNGYKDADLERYITLVGKQVNS